MLKNLTADAALDVLLEHTRPIEEHETVVLAEAHGRALADDLVAKVDHPSADDSAMDGYAVQYSDTRAAGADTPVRLELIGDAPAGRPFPDTVGAGQAVGVYTGAPIPRGADAVLKVEDTRLETNQVVALAPANPADIRSRGNDLRRGEVYLRRGDELTPGRVGLASLMGYALLPVVRRPRIGVLTTGDELSEPGEVLPYGGVYDANRFALADLVREAGGEPVVLARIADDPSDLEARLREAGPLDLLLSSGGVSMGAYDVVRHFLERQGEVLFWRVLVRPGGPLLFASWQGLPVLGLPGNPVSSMVTFFLFGRPMLFRMLGRAEAPYTRLKAVSTSVFKGAGPRTSYSRAVLSYDPTVRGAFKVASTGNQLSIALRSMSVGTALVVVPPHHQVGVGDEVEVIPLRFSL